MRKGDGVNKMKSGTWQYRFEGPKINGKRKQIVKGGFATHDEAYRSANRQNGMMWLCIDT